MKKIVFLVATVCLISGCTQHRIPLPSWIIPPEPEASEIILSETEFSLEKGQTYQLSAIVNPPEASPELMWHSSNEDILKVNSDGMVTAVATGDATVTVSAADNPSINAVCSVTVSDVVIAEGVTLKDLLEEKGLDNAISLSIAGTLADNDFMTLRDMSSLQHLDISGVSNATIPQAAFYQATFSTIELPSGLKTIGQWAFEDSAITELDIPDGVTEIQNSAFMNCYQLRKLTIPGSVETVGRWILQSFDESKWSFPDDVETVQVILEEGVKNLSVSSFYGAKIESITIPSSITEIPSWCFENAALESVTLHNGIKTIGDGAFIRTKLNSIQLPDELEAIGADAFIGEGYTLLAEMDELFIPASVKSIGARAFSGTGIKSVVFNEGLKTIEQAAFANIDFLSIELPSSLHSLADSAFDQYDSIKSITFKGAPPAITYTRESSGNLYAPALTGIENCIVYVPADQIKAYNESVWFKGTDVYGSNKTYFSVNNLKAIGS